MMLTQQWITMLSRLGKRAWTGQMVPQRVRLVGMHTPGQLRMADGGLRDRRDKPGGSQENPQCAIRNQAQRPFPWRLITWDQARAHPSAGTGPTREESGLDRPAA